MTAEGMDEQENKHYTIGWRKKSQDYQADEGKNLGYNGHADSSKEPQCGDYHHAENTGTFPGHFDETALNGVNVEYFVEIIGKNTIPQAICQGDADQNAGKYFFRLLFG